MIKKTTESTTISNKKKEKEEKKSKLSSYCGAIFIYLSQNDLEIGQNCTKHYSSVSLEYNNTINKVVGLYVKEKYRN